MTKVACRKRYVGTLAGRPESGLFAGLDVRGREFGCFRISRRIDIAQRFIEAYVEDSLKRDGKVTSATQSEIRMFGLDSV